MHERYVQCDLRRGPQVQTAFIPDGGAVAGKTLSLKTDGDGWQVVRAYTGVVLSGQILQAARDAHRHHRSQTDI